MMSNVNFLKFENSESLAHEFSKKVAAILEKTIKIKGYGTLLLSGGNTPKLFLNKLSNENIEWEKVTIGLVDERWIDTIYKDSNERLMKDNLLINSCIKANFIGLYQQNVSCEKSVSICSNLYKKYFKNCDVLILGMGIDGHTASIFPEIDNFAEAVSCDNKNFCIGTTPKNAPYNRMSLTLKSILDAKNIFLHIEGDEKLKVYNEAINDCNRYPISKVLCDENKQIEVYFA